jgi:hypothetical protein
MSYKRGKRWQVVVYAGRDPITGRKRQESVDQVYAILSGALNRAAVWGWIAQNPARLASPPSIEQADM